MLAILLAPALGVGAVATAVPFPREGRESTRQRAAGGPSDAACAFALGLALPAALLGIALVWSLRQLAMARPETDSDRVSYAFPPLAVLAGLGLARAAAELVLRCEKRRARPIRPAGAAAA